MIRAGHSDRLAAAIAACHRQIAGIEAGIEQACEHAATQRLRPRIR